MIVGNVVSKPFGVFLAVLQKPIQYTISGGVIHNNVQHYDEIKKLGHWRSL
jgi:hypothetical protein